MRDHPWIIAAAAFALAVIGWVVVFHTSKVSDREASRTRAAYSRVN